MTIQGVGVSVPGPADRFGGIPEGERDLDRLKRSSALLESEFVCTLFRLMRETVPRESPGSEGAMEIFWSLLEREMADRFAMGGGYGLGGTVAESLSGAREDLLAVGKGLEPGEVR